MKPGSYVELKMKNEEVFQGVLMPSNDDKIVSLKLDSGYNVGLDKKNVVKTSELKQSIQNKSKEKEIVNPNSELKTISILHTGGTIASKVSYATGAVSPSFEPEDLIAIFPELKSIANIKSRLVGNMFSEDMRFYHYNLLAKEVEKELKNGADGIIITHGTDTIPFTSAALTFALENLTKPVLVVGAQRSSDRPSSDAAMNLLCACKFIVGSDFNEVGICMHGKSGDEFCYILPPCKTKKLHTSRRDAFKAVNSEIIAKVSKEGKVEFLHEYKKKVHNDKLKLRLFNEKLKIGVLKVHPNMFAFEYKTLNKFNGVILEGTGLAGNLPINVVDSKTKEHKLIYNELKKLSKKIPVVAISQCIFGRVNMNVYDTGKRLQEIGVIGNFSDMSYETSFIKLVWLLSNYKKKDIKDLFMEDLRGEISKKINYDEEFV